jgi:phenylalanyl-tRNA synthetase alpha chain
MKQDTEQLRKSALKKISAAKNMDQLNAIRREYLSKKSGEITKLIKKLPNLGPEERRAAGQALNTAKSEIETALAERRYQLSTISNQQLFFDPTEPATPVPQGHLHLITQAIGEISTIFERLGFVRRRYPEIETDWYAFESLNMPPDHPARDEWETFFVSANTVVTPHTSSGQVREMKRQKPPIRMINISRCGRRQIDVSHVPTFYQFEGLLIDKDVAITHLKGVLTHFAKRFFGEKREIRLRPYDFRFTEPSFEIDINCGLCQGKGCRYCKAGWAELGGAGMVHPTVLRNGGIDPREYSGFAFGWGVERTYLMKSGINIPDIRMIYENDLRFLEQF